MLDAAHFGGVFGKEVEILVFFEWIHGKSVKGIFERSAASACLSEGFETEVFRGVDLAVAESALAAVEIFNVAVGEGGGI